MGAPQREAKYRQLTADPDAPERAPAPGELGLVQDFLRTNSYLDEPEKMRWWLQEQGLLDEPAGSADVSALVELRAALGSLLLANHDGSQPDTEATHALNRLAGEAPLVVRFGDSQNAELMSHRAGSGAAVASLLAIVYNSIAEGTWERMKICRNDECGWAFYDRSRNRSGAWCSMSDCGNLAKARAFRQRRRLKA
ncbi:MAG: CGNR zinc finger domain-containing protein [Dehalococcoidia bacterium]